MGLPSLSKRVPRATLVALLSLPINVLADVADDFLVFPGIIRTQLTDLDATSTREKLSFDPFVDFFYSAEFGEERQFRFLAEDIITENTHEIQRLQIGWQFNPKNVLWFGRFHTPVGYWNTEYHHGQYLTTSITRPSAVNFEGANGILPTHFTGLLLEGMKVAENSQSFEYIIASGLTSTFEGRLRPLDIADPGRSDNKLGIAARFAWRPDSLADNQLGGFIEHSTFDAKNSGAVQEIEQSAIGLYTNWHWNKFRLISALIFFDNELTLVGGRSSGSFTSAYAQGEYSVNDSVIAFGRLDKTTNGKTDPYLNLLPGYKDQRIAAGARWEFRKWQALTLEVAKTDTLTESFTEILVQWSALLE